jgi:hypothetical protein
MSRVASVSRYDHARGARDGAIGGGLTGLVAGLAFTALVTTSRSSCSDDCPPPPNGATLALRAGGLFALIGAAFGALLGAARGHEDRFVVAPD